MLAMLSAILLTAPPITVGERHALVGVLSEQGHLKCEGGDGTPWGGGEPVWTDPYPELGFVRLVPPEGLDLASAMGRPVVALGAPADGPPPARPEGCYAMQMRDDWVYGKSGMRVKRTRAPHVAFRATAVQVLDTLLAAERIAHGDGPAGDTVKLRLSNPFDRPLKALRLTLHHEGCYGKPGATAETARREALAPGESWTVTLPAFVDRKQGRGRMHAAAALTLDAEGERIAFDFDLPLHRLGVSVTCEDLRRPAKDPPDGPPQQQQQKKAR